MNILRIIINNAVHLCKDALPQHSHPSLWAAPLCQSNFARYFSANRKAPSGRNRICSADRAAIAESCSLQNGRLLHRGYMDQEPCRFFMLKPKQVWMRSSMTSQPPSPPELEWATGLPTSTVLFFEHCAVLPTSSPFFLFTIMPQ